jgi:lipopolysaccharide O-acetyltransferase
MEFARANGWYLLGEDSLLRVTTLLKSLILARKLKTSGLRIGPRANIRGLAYMKIGRDFHAGSQLWLQALTHYGDQVFAPRISIGESVRISDSVHIAATNYVEIGDGCLFGSKVLVIDHNHGQYSKSHSSPYDAPSKRLLDRDRSVVIGQNVWLGDSVVVGPGSIIGEGCIVGANSVVKGSLPPFTISSGNPAAVIKRFDFEMHEWVPAK